MISRFLLGLLIAGVLTIAQSSAQVSILPEELVGVYTIQAEERNGKQISEEHYKDVIVRIATNAITTYDKDKKEVFAATYTLDTGKKPWRLKMKATISPRGGVGEVSDGLIEKDGDIVRLIYALPKGPVPDEFKTVVGQQMFALKRMSK